MTRVALVSSEPLRSRMAGIGIRYVQMARRLSSPEIEVVLVSPAVDGSGDSLYVAGYDGTALETRPFVAGGLAELLSDCQAAVAQGQLANDVLIECPELPVAVDLYDPWLIENLHYLDSMGLDPYRNDHATWLLQMSRGDFFLCSSLEQRLFYLGFLTALGRVNPHRVEQDPTLETLIAIVPFGLDEELPPHRPYLEPAPEGRRRLLFGGLYDWYDPLTLLEALDLLSRDHEPELLIIRNPNSEGTPQRRLEEVERWCRKRSGFWGERVRLLDWVPYERRYDLLRDVDVQVAAHLPGLETDLSLRTRFLEALAAGCPVVVTEGGTLGRLLEQHEAGLTVPPGSSSALAEALAQVLRGGREVDRRVENGLALASSFAWPAVLEPVERFCRSPRRDTTKQAFVYDLGTVAPSDPFSFRLRRFLRRKR